MVPVDLDSKRKYFIWLNLIPGILPSVINKLLSYFKEPEKILKASKQELIEFGMDKNAAEEFINKRESVKLDEEIKKIEKYNAKIITINDENYPKRLKEIFDPPIVLYVLGELDDYSNISFSVVGTRKPTVYGRIVTEKIVSELVKKGITIVSGLARGIDILAHTYALKSKGKTIAVLGSGINIIYPPEHKNIANEIIKNGAIISEFPIDTQPERYNFPRRNRIISGISLGTLVVEAKEKSGALITADFALEQGREVFAIPGNINVPTAKGPNQLIKQGAKLVDNVDDILETIPEFTKLTTERLIQIQIPETLSEDEKIVFSLLSEEPKHIDIITRIAGMPISKISSILLELELKGLVKEVPGKLYIKSI
jgi:DNA processing protein